MLCEEISPFLLKEDKAEETWSKHRRILAWFQDIQWTNVAAVVNFSFILVNVSVSSGLVNFAKIISESGGVLEGILIQTVVFAFMIGTLLLMCHCYDLSGHGQYQDIVKHYAGAPSFIFCNVLIVVHYFGICVALLIIIGDQIERVFLLAEGSNYASKWYANRYFTIPATACLFILPFLFPKRIDGFKLSSLFGFLSCLYLIGLTLGKYLTGPGDGIEEDRPYSSGRIGTSQLFFIMGKYGFCFETHIVVVPIYAVQKQRSLFKQFWIILLATLLSAFIYNMVGCFGYLTFGSNVSHDLLVSYYPNAPVLVGMAMATIKCGMSYPVIFFCARTVLIDTSAFFFKSTSEEFEVVLRYIVTLVSFTLSVVVAVLVPSIGGIIGVLGASGILFIFFFPGLCCYFAYINPTTTSHRLILVLSIFLVGLGVFMAGIGYTEGFLHFGKDSFTV